MPIPFLGEVPPKLMRTILRVLPTREAIEALSTQLGERLEPAFYRMELGGNGATLNTRATLKINTRKGPFLILELATAPASTDTFLTLIPDDDPQVTNAFRDRNESGSLVAPIPVRRTLDAQLSANTTTPIAAGAVLSIGGVHLSERMLKAIEQQIGVQWSTVAQLVTSGEATKFQIPWDMEVIGLRMASTGGSSELAISIAGRYLLPNGSGQGTTLSLNPIFAGHGQARANFFDKDIASTDPMEEGMPQYPIPVEAGDEIRFNPATFADEDGGGNVKIMVQGRIFR